MLLQDGLHGLLSRVRDRITLPWSRFPDGDSLPKTLDYTGEFGPELVLFLPFVTWASQMGLLRQRRIATYVGMRCFYDEIDCVGVIEKRQRRRWVPPHRRPSWLPVRDEHSFDGRGRPERHVYPDLRAKFLRLPAPPEIEAATRPILVIHNKHNNEWDMGPVNHISIDTLDRMFTSLKHSFTLIYIRHGIRPIGDGFVEDRNTPHPFGDLALLDRHPEVICFDNMYNRYVAQGGGQDINTFKNVVYSRCHRFISSQGGGAHQIACFSGSLLLVLHRRGMEEHWAYGDGYYGFMATAPPIRAICRTEQEMLEALPLFLNSVVAEDRLQVSAGCEQLLEKLSPWTIAERR